MISKFRNFDQNIIDFNNSNLNSPQNNVEDNKIEKFSNESIKKDKLINSSSKSKKPILNSKKITDLVNKGLNFCNNTVDNVENQQKQFKSQSQTQLIYDQSLTKMFTFSGNNLNNELFSN